MSRIADIQIRKLKERMKQKGIALDVEDSVRELLAKNGYDPAYGARPLKRIIQSMLQNAIADRLLEDQPGRKQKLKADAKDGKVVVTVEEKDQG